jgi:predicted esterase
VVLDGMGPRRMRGWLSTGDRDRLQPVTYIRRVADHLTRREGFPEVETRVFRAGHTLGEEELAALVAWWLRRQDGPLW